MPASRWDDTGDLVIERSEGPFRLRRPYVYQDVDGNVRTIDARYEVLASNRRRVAFELAAYDTDRPLVIDPVLAYTSRFGGSETDVTQDVAVDKSGNAYVTGWTRSTDLSAPAGEDPGLLGTGGSGDAFITKLSADGSTVLYSTYLGGSNFDAGVGIGVDDEKNNVYVRRHDVVAPIRLPDDSRRLPLRPGRLLRSEARPGGRPRLLDVHRRLEHLQPGRPWPCTAPVTPPVSISPARPSAGIRPRPMPFGGTWSVTAMPL